MKRKNIKEKVILAILLLNLIIVSAGTVCASTNEVTVALPIQQIFEVESNETNNLKLIGTYELTRLTNEAPMPDGSNEHGVYTFTMDGKNVTNELSITFDHGGIYQYSLFQMTKETENYMFDKSNYTITVYVKNESKNQLISEVIVENGNGKKCGQIRFKNAYKEKIIS